MMSLKTVSERLADSALSVKNELRLLLENHSSIHNQESQHLPGDQQRGGIFAIGYSMWKPLSVEGTRVQARALSQYEAIREVMRVLLQGQPQTILSQFRANDRLIISAIQQINAPSRCQPKDICVETIRCLDGQLALITQLFDGSDHSTVIVPDTNALLFNPSLEDWSFEGVSRLTVVLVPTVLGELDALKMHNRSDHVREKAESIIKRIKGYRGRGSLTEGVPLRKGISTVVGYATEPRMEDSLSWLRRENADDRLLASVLFVMGRFPQSTVVLVTRDINLQNKAELARVSY